MKIIYPLAGISAIAMPMVAASFTINSLVQFQPSAGSAPIPDPTFSATSLLIDLPGQQQYSASNTPGLPSSGQTNSLSNSANSASYTVTQYSALPTLVYGLSAQGAFSNASLLAPGYGPDFVGTLELDQAPGGTITAQIDNTLVGSGPGDASSFSFSTESFSAGGTIFLSPVTALMDLRGDGQATWLGSQGTYASGSNYTISFGLSYLASGGTATSWSVTVVNGAVASETNSSSNPILLPAIGSSGDFMIPLPIDAVSF
jgi:hypothetical protein